MKRPEVFTAHAMRKGKEWLAVVFRDDAPMTMSIHADKSAARKAARRHAAHFRARQETTDA